MEDLKLKGCKVRVIPNLAGFSSPWSFHNAILGTWIRPEDLDIYSHYIEAVEFYNEDVENEIAKERALYNVYIKDGEWNDELMLLITGLSTPGLNSIMDSEAVRKRINCGKKCQVRGICRLCEQVFDLADVKRLQNFVDKYSKN